jgi:predicted Zn-dependent protease
MLKQIVFIVGIILLLQPVSLAGQEANRGQADTLFSELDKIFSGEQSISPEDGYYLGRAVAANILAIYKPYTANPELTNYLNLICQVLVINSAQPAVYNDYHVVILDSVELNALSTPGGHIFITKGLIDIAPSEDALAGIIAHELAHIMLKHGLKMIDDMKIVSEAGTMAQRASSFSGKSNTGIISFRNSVTEIFDSMVKSGYSQPQEFEADTLAVELLATACYDSRGLLEALGVLQNARQQGGIFSTHPSPAQRIANIEERVSVYRVPDNSSFRQERFKKVTGRN